MVDLWMGSMPLVGSICTVELMQTGGGSGTPTSRGSTNRLGSTNDDGGLGWTKPEEDVHTGPAACANKIDCRLASVDTW